MKLSPRYSAPPVVAFDDAPATVLAPLVRQRERLERLLDELSPDEWHAPSRCEGWTVKDLVAHLVSVNNYWAFSITSGVAGKPSQALADFDPVAVPAALAAADASTSAVEMAERFRVSNRQLCHLVTSLDDADWRAIAECPIGHVSVAVVAHHALWDFLVHEWDIALPLHRPRVAEHDEVLRSLAYASALNAALMLLSGADVPHALAIETTNPQAAFAFETADSVAVRPGVSAADAPCLRDDAVTLLEAVSVRAPLPASVPAEWRAVLESLHETFDQALA